MATTTVRWVRGDDDRLHVGTVDGRRLGWYDLRTGDTELLEPGPGAAADLRAAVDAYVATTSPLRRRPPVHALATRPPAPRVGDDGPLAAAGGPRPDDLRHRLPGEHLTRTILQRVGAAPARRWWTAARDPFGPALRHAHQAVLGQQRTARVLAGLGPGWHVLHDVPVQPRSWVDHLLVGPGGVVVLRTAAHPGERVRVAGSLVRAGGRPVSHVRVLRGQTATVTERLRGADLPVAVRGVVVVVGARGVQATGLPAGVSVVRLDDLARWVADLPTVLSRLDVSRLVETASRPGTWPAEADDEHDLTAEERRRRREADRAALARLGGRAREAGRLRAARRAVVLGAAGTGALGALSVLAPGVLPSGVLPSGVLPSGVLPSGVLPSGVLPHAVAAVTAVGMIGG